MVCVLRTQAQSFEYLRLGSAHDAPAHPRSGIALMGGGPDLDEAFRWLCAKADGGDFLVLRAEGSTEYNNYISKLCSVNSVATLVIPDRAAAQDARVSKLIRSAAVIFIAGGDQARYIDFWKGTAVQKALNSNLAKSKPVGGTSAGLAVMGEFIYGALEDKPEDKDLTSDEVLANPYFRRVTLVRDFLKIPLLKNTLTDSHFAKRDRMGRSLGFLARIVQEGWSAHPREIAIDENSALLVEPDGRAQVVGTGRGAYFLALGLPPEMCKPETALSIRDIQSYHARGGTSFDLKLWVGTEGEPYSVSAIRGKMRSSIRRVY